MEVRRSARVATSFLVAIQGLEREVVLRRGNISATGVYFVTEADPGDVGMMSWLTLVSFDRQRSINVMAYVVRSVRFTDIDGHELTGAAFEFIPENDVAAAAVQDFVRYVLALRRDGIAPHVSTRLDASASSGSGNEAATVRDLTVRSLTLETDWEVPSGETVLVDIFAPGMTNRIRVEGRAVRVLEKPTGDVTSPRYFIELAIEQQSERPLQSMAPPPDTSAGSTSAPLELVEMRDEEVAETIDSLLTALVIPPQAAAARGSRATHLSGVLSQISLPTLLSLLEMEQLTGKLVVRTVGGDPTFIFVSQGQVLDVEPLGRFVTPRGRLASLLPLGEGTFEFYAQNVEREDRIGARTTALLLDLSRVLDEASRDDDD
jgi:hypothetical protein